MTRQAPTTKLVRPLRSGQITIPVTFRKALGITRDTLLEVTLEHGSLHITPARLAQTAADTPWFKDLYDLFAPVREEAQEHSEDEINQAIDQAVTAARNTPHAHNRP